jgi:hypothetical protein
VETTPRPGDESLLRAEGYQVEAVIEDSGTWEAQGRDRRRR